MTSSNLLCLPHEVRTNILHNLIFNSKLEPRLCHECANTNFTVSIYPHSHQQKRNKSSPACLYQGVLLTCHQLHDEATSIIRAKTAAASIWLELTPDESPNQDGTNPEMLSIRNKTYSMYQQAHLFGHFHKQIKSLQLTIRIKEAINGFVYFLSTLLELLTALLRWSPSITHLFLHFDLQPAPLFPSQELYGYKHREIVLNIVESLRKVRGFTHVDVSGRLDQSIAVSLATWMMTPDVHVKERNALLRELRHARSRERWVDIARLICFDNGACARELLGVPTLIVANMRKRAWEQWEKRVRYTQKDKAAMQR